jgi:hypothetical protein
MKPPGHSDVLNRAHAAHQAKRRLHRAAGAALARRRGPKDVS